MTLRLNPTRDYTKAEEAVIKRLPVGEVLQAMASFTPGAKMILDSSCFAMGSRSGANGKKYVVAPAKVIVSPSQTNLTLTKKEESQPYLYILLCKQEPFDVQAVFEFNPDDPNPLLYFMDYPDSKYSLGAKLTIKHKRLISSEFGPIEDLRKDMNH